MRSYRLAAAAEQDVIIILKRTQRIYGDPGRKRYEALLVTALRDIAADPERVESRPIPAEFGLKGRIYHLRHSRSRAITAEGAVRSPRHFLVYRARGPDMVEIARSLHDSMDLRRHLGSGAPGAISPPARR